MNFGEQNLSLEKCPALVLNADYRPLSYYPLSLWSWQDSVKSVFLDRVSIVSNYDRVIRSPSFDMKLPSVIALKSFIKPLSNPSFTRFNVFLRDKFSCQYCGSKHLYITREHPFWLSNSFRRSIFVALHTPCTAKASKIA